MDKTALLEKIKNNALSPDGNPTHAQALVALKELEMLDHLTGVEKDAIAAARSELTQVVAAYRRVLRVKKDKRKKRTRG